MNFRCFCKKSTFTYKRLHRGSRGPIPRGNPFVGSTTETLWMLGEQIRNRGHIAKQQEGFYMNANNVKLDGQEGIYIKATRTDESYIESIWPSQIPSAKIFNLLDDLPKRVTQLETEIK